MAIKENQRVIIVFGMARAGTTIFTHVLSQHRKIKLFHNVYNYENDLIFAQKHRAMERIVLENPRHMVLFKRPWSEKLVGFWKENFPNAYYIALLKPFDSINQSWQKSKWTRALHNGDDKRRRRKYDRHRELLDEYADMKLKIVDYNYFVSDPDKTMKDVSSFLDLKYTRRCGQARCPQFDTSVVKEGGDWRKFRDGFK